MKGSDFFFILFLLVFSLSMLHLFNNNKEIDNLVTLGIVVATYLHSISVRHELSELRSSLSKETSE